MEIYYNFFSLFSIGCCDKQKDIETIIKINTNYFDRKFFLQLKSKFFVLFPLKNEKMENRIIRKGLRIKKKTEKLPINESPNLKRKSNQTKGQKVRKLEKIQYYSKL